MIRCNHSFAPIYDEHLLEQLIIRGHLMGKQIVTAKFIQREPLVSLIQVTLFLIVVQFQRSIYGF